MMATVHPPVIAYHFGRFRLSVRDRILEHNGERLQLTPKVIDTLFVLVENARQVVNKEDLMKAVWPDVLVVESGLTRNMSTLRKALEEGREGELFIETIPRRGYRFIAEVTEELSPDPTAFTPAPIPVPPVELNGSSSRRLWGGISILVIVALASSWLFVIRKQSRTTVALEPSVRIGEHLLYKLAPEETIRASEHFEHAIAKNPASAGAHAGLAISLLHISMLGIRSVSEILPQAEQAAHRGAELGPQLSSAHYAIGGIHLLKWNFGAADAAFRRTLELEPDSVQARFGYSQLKLTTGDLDGAQRLVEEALRLDPASPPLGTQYCRVLYFRRNFHRAESECRQVLARETGYGLAHYYLALSLGSLGRIAEASESLDRSGLMPGVLEADRAWLSVRQGDRRPAQAVLEKRRELVIQRKVDATAKLLLATALGRMDEAYEALEVGLATHAPELLLVHLEPRLDPLRSDPRYASVLRRIGIPSL